MKALIKSQEAVLLSQLFYLLSFHFSISFVPVPGGLPPVLQLLSLFLCISVFKPDLHSGTREQIGVPLKLTVRLPSHNHSHNPNHCCHDSKKTKICSSLKTCFIHPRFNSLFASYRRLHIVTFCSV